MSEIGWIRLMQRIYADPERAAGLADSINADFDKAQASDPYMVKNRELAWRQAYVHQLAKIATGQEEAKFGPMVHPYPKPGNTMRLWTIFEADFAFESPIEEVDIARNDDTPQDEPIF